MQRKNRTLYINNQQYGHHTENKLKQQTTTTVKDI